MRNFIYLLVMFSSLFSFSQNDKREERIKSLRIAVISQKLDLSSEESEKFWPIFNKYADKILVLQKERMKLKKEMKNGNENNALETLENVDEKDEEILSLKKQMKKELIPVIGAQKVLKLQEIENDFKAKMLEKLQNRRRRN